VKTAGQASPQSNSVREVSRPCPVCDGRYAELVFQQSFQSFERGGPIEGYDVVVCTACGTSFADGIPSQSEFDEYYRELSKYEYEYRAGKESEDDSLRLKKLADILQSIVPDRNSRILEIGCANGRLLSYLKEAAYSDVRGIDPSPGCARAAKLLYDVAVETGTVFGLPKPDAGYNFVVTLGVLEHIRDLKQAVQNIRNITSKDGRVFVGVPDASKLIAAQDAPFQEFSTEHITFFSPTSVQYLMEACGFRTVSCASVSLELHRGVLTPTVCGVFAPSAHFRKEFRCDSTTREGLIRYIDECKAMDTRLRNRIRGAVDGRRVVVWGVGTHTRRLLANDTLRPGDISAFVDANPKYQGQQLIGIPVLSPDHLTGHREPILISSYAFQKEISDEIRDRLRLPNELILLYDMNNSTVWHG
jgi:SAM-dependent methyltransferase